MSLTPEPPTGPLASDVFATAAPEVASLATAVRELELHVASGGWDGPIRVFSLVKTQGALATNPSLAESLPTDVIDLAANDPRHLISIEQEGLPAADGLEELLAQMAWPEAVDGAAVVAERIVIPPEAEADMPAEPQAAIAYVENHPAREDVRLAVGVLRDGSSWCALRTRKLDRDDAVAGGPSLVPGLVSALLATFQ